MPLSVLLTDDSRIARKMIRAVLPDRPLSIREACGGNECLALYQDERPDLVILDLTMPDINGLEVLERLRELDPDARVVIVTADIQSTNQTRARELGAINVLEKPPKPRDIADVIEGVAA